jgi:archaellum component FlaC
MKIKVIIFVFFLLSSCSISDPEMMELLREIKAQNETLLEDVEEMRSQLEGLDGKYQVILASLADNKKELEDLKTQIDALKAQLTQQLDKINQLSTQLEVQGADVKKLSSEIAALKASCEELKGLIEELLSDKSPIPTNGLIAWYPFNGNANDESGNGFNGTIIGASLTTDRKENPGKAYIFDGKDDFILVKHQQKLNLPGSGTSFSFSTWILPNESGKLDMNIISKGQGNGMNSKDVFIFSVYKSNLIGMQLSNFPNAFWTSSVKTISFKAWNHLSVVYNHVENSSSYFINGIFAGKQVYSFVPSSNNDVLEMFIGKQGYNCNCNFMDGKIDDVAIWNRELTAEEISKIFKGEKF